MIIVGLTGGIGTGKSTVARAYRSVGVDVVDADHIARQVVVPGTPLLKEIAARWDVLTPQGTLDRKKLAGIVFKDPVELEALNRMTHPAIQAKAEELISQCTGDVVVYDIPLLFETGWDDGPIVVVKCPHEVQIQRVMKRDNCTREEALDRINAQMPLIEKAKMAHYVIDSDGPKEETRAKALWVLEEIRRLATT